MDTEDVTARPDPPVRFSGHALRMLRTDRRMRQGDLAAACRVTVHTIRSYEAEVITPSMPVLCRLVVALDCQVSGLFTDTRARVEVPA